MSVQQVRRQRSGSRRSSKQVEFVSGVKATSTASNDAPLELVASTGASGYTLVEITGTSGANTNGSTPVTTSTITGGAAAGGLAVKVNGTVRYIPLYATS